MQAVIERDIMSPSHAAKLVGKCDFVNSTLFGRVGRAALAVLRAHQYQQKRDWSLTPALRHALQWLMALFLVAPSRALQLRTDTCHPWILYSDACFIQQPPNWLIKNLDDFPS
eukprot:993732-Amphidinium_carterae.1